ncbi:MAG: hypothetical protein FWC00_04130 [Firmicutes bacterium]|nr:hypothetical protein [Bacillota bacterium]
MQRTETKIEVAVDVDPNDVCAIMLVPNNLLDADVCGLKVSQWVAKVVSGYDNTPVKIKRGDDIITIVKENAANKRFCVVVYADTPLIKGETIAQALSFIATYKHRVLQLPRGWVFDVDHIKKGKDIKAVAMPNLEEEQFLVAYNHSQIATIASHMRARINEKHLANKVHIIDPFNAYIDAQVKIGAGTIIGPGVMIRGECEIGKNCRFLNAVEIKKSIIGDGTTVKHMTYVGDAEIGANCNLGNGVIFCNYDGKNKHKTTIGNNVFIGGNVTLVAPIVIGDNAFIAAGSTITQDVPEEALAIARARQAMKENWRNPQPKIEAE